jgi:hypothetical protein
MDLIWQKKNISGIDCLVPFCNDSEQKLAEFKANQPCITNDMHGTNRARSVDQLHLYFQACKFTAKHTSDPSWNTKDLVDWQCRNGLQFFDTGYTFVSPSGVVTFKVRSISFKTLRHAEACDYLDRALQLMADHIGVDLELFINEVKNSVGLK